MPTLIFSEELQVEEEEKEEEEEEKEEKEKKKKNYKYFSLNIFLDYLSITNLVLR